MKEEIIDIEYYKNEEEDKENNGNTRDDDVIVLNKGKKRYIKEGKGKKNEG